MNNNDIEFDNEAEAEAEAEAETGEAFSSREVVAPVDDGLERKGNTDSSLNMPEAPVREEMGDGNNGSNSNSNSNSNSGTQGKGTLSRIDTRVDESDLVEDLVFKNEQHVDRSLMASDHVAATATAVCISRHVAHHLQGESKESDDAPQESEDTRTANSDKYKCNCEYKSNESTFVGQSEEQKQDRQGEVDPYTKLLQVSSSNKNETSHEQSHALPLTLPVTQVDPRDQKMPASSAKQMPSTASSSLKMPALPEQQYFQGASTSVMVASSMNKSRYQTLLPTNDGDANERVGAFREAQGEEPSGEFPANEYSHEPNASTPLMLVNATLVVEDEPKMIPQESSSIVTKEGRSNIDIDPEDGSETGRSSSVRVGTSNPEIPVRDMHSDIVVESVVMDESLTGYPQDLELVVASPIHEKKGIWHHRKTRMFVMGLVVLGVIISIAVVFGVDSTGDKEKGVEAPNARSNDEEVGNTTEGFIRYVLPEYTLAALEDPDSDQSLALAWLWKDPNATSMLPNFRRVQRFALATSFFAMANAVDQENIRAAGGWMSEAHECTWMFDSAQATVCQNEELRSYDLRNFALNGTIPAEIGLLTKLVSVDISDNHIFGTLPSTLGHLLLMDQFIADDCALTGHIPTEFALWTNLRRCSLTNNQLTSTIPTEFGRLDELQQLALESNMLTGKVPSEIGELSQLSSLNLHDNTLTGVIPTELGKLTDLFTMVALSQNSMSGTLPTELGNLNGILYMHFDGNRFSGTIPEEFGGLLELRLLTLNNTRVTGSVPSAVCALVDSGGLSSLLVDCEEVSCSCDCECSSGLT